MDPIEFPSANKTIGGPAAGQPEYTPLPILTDGESCASYWQLTWSERLSALFFGRFSLKMLTGHTQPPILPQITRHAPRLEEESDDAE